MYYYGKEFERRRLKFHRQYSAWLMAFMAFLAALNVAMGCLLLHLGNLPLGAFLWLCAGLFLCVLVSGFRYWCSLGRDLNKLL